MRIKRKVLHHILVNFFLQVNTHSTVRANDFVGANTGPCGDVSTWVRDTNISRVITYRVVCALDCRGSQLLKKFRPRARLAWCQ